MHSPCPLDILHLRTIFTKTSRPASSMCVLSWLSLSICVGANLLSSARLQFLAAASFCSGDAMAVPSCTGTSIEDHDAVHAMMPCVCR